MTACLLAAGPTPPTKSRPHTSLLPDTASKATSSVPHYLMLARWPLLPASSTYKPTPMPSSHPPAAAPCCRRSWQRACGTTACCRCWPRSRTMASRSTARPDPQCLPTRSSGAAAGRRGQEACRGWGGWRWWWWWWWTRGGAQRDQRQWTQWRSHAVHGTGLKAHRYCGLSPCLPFPPALSHLQGAQQRCA